MTITKPILAVDCDFNKLDFSSGILAQPKIDGVRGLWLYTKPTFSGRSLKPFGNSIVSDALSHPLLRGIDGELTFGSITAPDLCRTTTSVVNTHNDPRANQLVLNAFDYITPDTIDLGYTDRYQRLLDTLQSINLPNVSVVPYQVINSLDELLAYEQTILSSGYEGVILRKLDGLYKNGRTTVREGTYLRIKRFTQEDAIVLSLVEAMENTNEAIINELGHTERSTHQNNLVPKGMIGSLICRDIKSGNTITVGPGSLTHEQRIYYWNNQSELVDQTISYKYFEHGQKDKPRFPSFVSVRPPEDLVSE